MKTKTRKILSLLLTLVLALGIMSPMSVSALSPSAIDPAQFANPDMQYRPGVRWWWPGNAPSVEDLKAQIDHLEDNGFGAVEIVAFTAGFLQKPNGTSSERIYMALDEYDKESVLGYDTPEYYEKLKAVVEYANERGIIVDLNAGSGYLANDDSVDIADSQSSMALGRATISGTAGTSQTVPIPAAEVGALFGVTVSGYDTGEWSKATLNAVVVAKKTGDGTAMTNRNQTIKLVGGKVTSESTVDKTYARQALLDLKNAQVFHVDSITGGSINFTPTETAEYEVVALYSVPSGSVGLNSFVGGPKGRSYVADHLNGDALKKFVDGWLGDPGLKKIVDNYDIRAAFNDSYEFYTDTFYNDNVYEMAKSQSLLGYDITRFVPSIYVPMRQTAAYGGSHVAKIPGLNVGSSTTTWLASDTATLTSAENTRVTYDYNQLVNEAFLEGMEAFSSALGNYGMVYRQQAYNPPVDTLKSAKYVDIPETEGESEYSLKRVASGAHLYGKNLVTSEVYTLGNVPFNVQPQKIKNGFDLMATSGVNNFFYHGLSATYYGTDGQKDSGLFVEEGWRAWPTIGVEMSETESMSSYYKSMNAYAARANFTMQTGKQSSDVAVYMPLFGSINGNSVTSQTLNANGYVWDAINDDSIQNLVYDDGKLVTEAGTAYSALVIDQQTLQVATMEALQALAAEGAPIIFYGNLPNAQPSYAGGNYAELDARIAGIASAMIAGNAVNVTNAADLTAELGKSVAPPISYESNANVRFNRRTLESGGELAYIRNTSTAAATTIVLEVSDSLPNRYWLDQSTGKIYKADNMTITLPANSAIVLLCEPDGVEMTSGAISEGLPLAIHSAEAIKTQELTGFILEVTADNIGTNIPGEAKTVTYTEDVLGNWANDSFHGGELKYVCSAGSYKASFEVTDLSAYKNNRLIIGLGTVNSAATVRVNGETEGQQVFYAPYEVDITDALVEGTNILEIEVQPLKHNRRVGLRLAYSNNGIAKYRAYQSHVSSTTLTAAGLVGPVTMITKPSAEETGAFRLSTGAHNIIAGDYFNVNASFKEIQNSNAVVLNYTFDGDKFEYANYTPVDGVKVVDVQYGEGCAKITLMIPSYNAKNLGDIMLRAKEGAIFSREKQSVWVTADYVLKDDAGDKTINTLNASTSFTTVASRPGEPAVPGDTNDDHVIDIIDLSNMIDWFGTKSNNAKWDSFYTFFDFNNNGEIDISDISYVARLIK